MSEPRFAWMNGAVIPWEDCVLHGRSQAAFWGANIFEGVRAYWDEEALTFSIFRLAEHLDRLRASAKCMRMELPYDDSALQAACIALLQANGLAADVHMVIVGYFGMGPDCDPMGLIDEVGVHISALPMPRSPRFTHGTAICVSSWRRIGDDTMPPRIKTGANYHNSRLAHQEAVRNGYDTALFLNQRGHVAEAPGSCIVMVREGRLFTPPGTSGVLEGITLKTVAQIAEAELGLDMVRRDIDRTELYLADEAFLCGTLAEIQPVTSIDRIEIGCGVPGRLTRELQMLFDRHLRSTGRFAWSTPVEMDRASRPHEVAA